AIMRVTFPTFSRLQDHKEIIKKSLEKSLFFIALFVFPAVAGIALIAPDIINIIPKYTKWLPAIIPLYFYAGNVAIASITTPLTNAFNATGKILLTTKFMIMWTVLTWILFPLLTIKYGILGASVAAILVGISSVLVWISAYRLFQVNVLKTVLKPLIASLIMIFIILMFQQLGLNVWVNLFGKISLGILTYGLYLFLFSKAEINWFIHQLQCLISKR
ncbi:MAG: polysaccharide biosynthesis C-terminal domain-containing protein, partial [Candidatus Shapirobacteria bacterium]|nr:polysaccharide biosynthesis C-terminal domain-containing protein [Candidatus Shapirobacteria bacterium]